MRDANYGQRVSGINYIDFLGKLHKKLTPKTYLEIGVHVGNSLKQASCASIAIDPHFIYETNIIGAKPLCLFYQMTSDNFFSTQSPMQILGQPIDLAFLDGLHWFDFLLRDFMNTEKHCSSQSTIVLHDCLPPGFIMTSRNYSDSLGPDVAEGYHGAWTGDVWKIIPTLQKYRPDLSVVVTDCSPTGLVIVTNLNPEDKTLIRNNNIIINEFKLFDRDEYENYWNYVEITPFSKFLIEKELR